MAGTNEQEKHIAAVGRGGWGWAWTCICGDRADKDFQSQEYAIAAARRHVRKHTGASAVMKAPAPIEKGTGGGGADDRRG